MKVKKKEVEGIDKICGALLCGRLNFLVALSSSVRDPSSPWSLPSPMTSHDGAAFGKERLVVTARMVEACFRPVSLGIKHPMGCR